VARLGRVRIDKAETVTPTNRKLIGHLSDDPDFRKDEAALMALGYRLLGTLADAQDAVQETYVRWYSLDREERQGICVPLAWKRTTLTRICFDRLKSSQYKREVYVGEWLPEPVQGGEFWGLASNPAANAGLETSESVSESISMALMIVLDKMTPPERVSFILHDVFQYTFEEIAEIIGRTPQACRQLAFSARKRLGNRARRQSSREEHARLNEAFRAAWQTGNVTALIALLDSDAEAITDGGGKTAAATEPLIGSHAIAEFFAGIFERQPDLQVEIATVNGEPGLIGMAGDQIISVISTSVRNGVIHNIWAMRNPDKLRAWFKGN
jgi:RNA polymerase sigma factor (sigma-70 family)